MKTVTASSTPRSSDRYPDFAGRPKRINLDQIVAVKGQGKLNIRPIRLDDEQETVRFHTNISEESIYMRYFEYLGLDRRTSHERLVRICMNTPQSYAVVVERCTTPHHPAAILAVGRLTTTEEPFVASFDTLLADGAGADHVGKLLLRRLMKLVKAFGFQFLKGELLVADHDALNLCRSLGFSLQTIPQDGVVNVTIQL